MKYFLLSLLAIGSTLSYGQVQIKGSDTSTKYLVAVDSVVRVSLIANPSSGYRWRLIAKSNNAVVDSVSCQFIPFDKGVVGGGGSEVWSFKALQKGVVDLTFVY